MQSLIESWIRSFGLKEIVKHHCVPVYAIVGMTPISELCAQFKLRMVRSTREMK